MVNVAEADFVSVGLSGLFMKGASLSYELFLAPIEVAVVGVVEDESGLDTKLGTGGFTLVLEA